jgi:hypothetical protein
MNWKVTLMKLEKLKKEISELSDQEKIMLLSSLFDLQTDGSEKNQYVVYTGIECKEGSHP